MSRWHFVTWIVWRWCYWLSWVLESFCNKARCSWVELVGCSVDPSHSSNCFCEMRQSSVCWQLVARGMKARGSGGSIVNVSSQASQRALREHAVYCENTDMGAIASIKFKRRSPVRVTNWASVSALCSGATKAALDMLSKVMALELGPHQVHHCPVPHVQLPPHSY